jgi:hypothetical protein
MPAEWQNRWVLNARADKALIALMGVLASPAWSARRGSMLSGAAARVADSTDVVQKNAGTEGRDDDRR